MQGKTTKYVQKLLIILYRKKRAQIKSLADYRKSNSKKQLE